MLKAIGLSVLAVGLLMPVANLQAQEHHDQIKHEWNDGENEHWRQYLKEHHIKDHDWAKAKKRERDAYWKWRDGHR